VAQRQCYCCSFLSPLLSVLKGLFTQFFQSFGLGNTLGWLYLFRDMELEADIIQAL